MTPLDFLYVTLSVSVIIIALAIIIVTIVFITILWEIRRMMGSIREAMLDVRGVSNLIKDGVVGNVVNYGKKIFQKRRTKRNT